MWPVAYVEGMALSVIPVEHAWCVDPDDRVVDPTWEGGGSAYFGAEFSLDDLRRLRKETRHLSIVWDYPRAYPLLRPRDLVRGGAYSVRSGVATALETTGGGHSRNLWRAMACHGTASSTSFKFPQ